MRGAKMRGMRPGETEFPHGSHDRELQNDQAAETPQAIDEDTCAKRGKAERQLVIVHVA
jgi:hypothetical protein